MQNLNKIEEPPNRRNERNRQNNEDYEDARRQGELNDYLLELPDQLYDRRVLPVQNLINQNELQRINSAPTENRAREELSDQIHNNMRFNEVESDEDILEPPYIDYYQNRERIQPSNMIQHYNQEPEEPQSFHLSDSEDEIERQLSDDEIERKYDEMHEERSIPNREQIKEYIRQNGILEAQKQVAHLEEIVEYTEEENNKLKSQLKVLITKVHKQTRKKSNYESRTAFERKLESIERIENKIAKNEDIILNTLDLLDYIENVEDSSL